MAEVTAKPSLIKATRDAVKACPREIFSGWLFFCVAVWSFSGVAKGFDEGRKTSAFVLFRIADFVGNIASIVVMKVFKKSFGIDHETEAQYANTKGWIVAIATAGAVFGCLACINIGQILGRKKTMLLFTIVYIAGILGQTFCGGSLAGLYVSRFISGIGIGTTTVLPSIYITEVSRYTRWSQDTELTARRSHLAPFAAY
jgi:MFS family permease